MKPSVKFLLRGLAGLASEHPTTQVLYCTQYCNVLCTALWLCCTVLYCTVLWLYCTVLHFGCTVLYCTVLSLAINVLKSGLQAPEILPRPY